MRRFGRIVAGKDHRRRGLYGCGLWCQGCDGGTQWRIGGQHAEVTVAVLARRRY
jgi:hypothetical protein